MDLLTRHEIGPKEGACIVPAVFAGERCTKEQAQRIDPAFLDSDAGFTLREISVAISRRGWSAIISSTHSHLATRTRVNRDNWRRFRATIRDPNSAASAFLESEKGYLSRVAAGARLAEETNEFAIIGHQPCPKFRIASLMMSARTMYAGGMTGTVGFRLGAETFNATLTPDAIAIKRGDRPVPTSYSRATSMRSLQ